MSVLLLAPDALVAALLEPVPWVRQTKGRPSAWCVVKFQTLQVRKYSTTLQLQHTERCCFRFESSSPALRSTVYHLFLAPLSSRAALRTPP
jgi:hypothetical protein